MRCYTVLVGLTCFTGCFPVLAHPTRVESGFKLSSFTSVSLVSDSTGEPSRATYTVLPSIDFEASLGIRDTSRIDGPGLRLAASGGLSGLGASAYLEWPRDQFGDFDLGFGIAGHGGALNTWTPYLQVGRYESEDMSWFVRNGVTFATSSDSTNWAVLWVPTVGIVRHRPYRDAALFLSAVVGSQQAVDGPCFFSCEGPTMRTRVMLGASVSFTLMTPYRPDRR
jgi:hypothetical protein